MLDREEKTYKEGRGHFIQRLHFQLIEEKLHSEWRILCLKELETDPGMRSCSRTLSFPTELD